MFTGQAHPRLSRSVPHVSEYRLSTPELQ